MKRVTIATLACSLGYCCEYAFFRLYKKTGLIAARLGVSKQAVKARKALWRAKKIECKKLDCCQLEKIKALGK